MEGEGRMNGLLVDLEKLSLERGRPLDVDDLDDEGWRAASDQDMIVELGSLGEGAGGAVTRCILKGGKTVFALKVWPWPLPGISFQKSTDRTDNYDRSESRREKTDPSRTEFQQKLRLGAYLPLLWSVYG